MTDEITLDHAALELEPDFREEESKQVEDVDVIFLPKKDFTARVNQDDFNFRQDVPTRVPRAVANMLLEDPDRGYIKD